MRSTVLFLGASHQQLAPIEYARSAGHRVITADNCPANPGHALADESYSVSTTDVDGILKVARKERVNAVVSYATDVAAPTAAEVAEQLGIPGNPPDAVRVLTNKARFREFQIRRGHFAPAHRSFDRSDLKNARGVVGGKLDYPVVVKPVDASGFKGVSHVANAEDLLAALTNSLDFSLCGRAVVEQFVPRQGYQVCGEGFLQDGRIIFHAFANEHFCEGIGVPVGETFPCMFDQRLVDKAVGVLQSIFSDLGMRQGPFNFDLFFTPDEDVFVVEIGPRNGGNGIPEAIRFATGVDTIAATVNVALGRSVGLAGDPCRYTATYSVHAKQDGILESIEYVDIRDRILSENVWTAPGDRVERFDRGPQMLGILILGFEDYAEMLSTLARMDDHVRVNVTSN